MSDDDRRDLPPASSPQFLERVREILSTYLGRRGDPLKRGVILQDLVDADIVTIRNGWKGGSSPIGGIGGAVAGGGTDTEPDLTPPPTPTGVVVTPTFSNLIIEHDAPVYTQGHGHARTKVHGATYSGSGPLPIFTEARLLTEFTGTVFAHPTTLGTSWRIWLTWESNDGVESLVPSGGTNGAAATTGHIGHSDLGPLIVEADNLVDGTITAAKVAANAIDLTKFANGIEPVTIITSGGLPATLVTKFIFWTDNKLYRWNGSAYTKQVDGADIVANSITAGQIAAGAIGATQIAAGAITAGKLLVTGQGTALNTDPNFKDSSHWVISAGAGSFLSNAGTGGVAPNYLGVTARDTWVYDNIAFPIDPNGTYIERANIYSGASGSGSYYLAVLFYDDDGNFISQNGWGGTWSGYPSSGTPAVGWHEYSGDFGAGTSRPIPSSARTCRVGAILKYSTSDTTTGWGIQNLRVERKVGADLIVDGAIIASKLSAGAIAVGSAAIADGAIRNALIANLAVDDAKVAGMSVAKLLAGSLSVGQYVRSTSYVAGSSGWTINADGSAEFAAGVIRGQLTASQIDTRNLTIKDGAGNVLFGSGTALNYANITPSSGWLNSNVTIDSNGTLQGIGTGAGASVANNLTQNAVTRIPHPLGGTFGTNTSSVSGVIFIILPASWNNTMMRMDIEIYEYAADAVQTYTVGGYNYESANWHNTFANYSGSPAKARRVGFGRDSISGRPMIAIGSYATSWTYPQIKVSNLVLGYNGSTDSAWNSAFSVTIEASRIYSEQAYVTTPTPGGALSGADAINGGNVGSFVSTSAGLHNSSIGLTVNADGSLSASGGPSTSGGVTPVGIGAVKTDATNAPGILRNDNIGITLNSNGTLSVSGGPSASGGVSAGGLGAVKTDLTNAPSGILNNAISITVNANGTLSVNGGPSVSGAIAIGSLSGAGAFATLNAITSVNVSTYIQSAAIDYTRIGVLQAQNLSVVALSNTVNGGVTSTGRVDITSNRIDVYDDSNVRRVRLGML